MNPITKWNIPEKYIAVVREELGAWLQLFISLAGGRTGNVYRADWENFDLFYFTECNDLVSKEIESTGVEAALDIRRRKRAVLMQIFIRSLLGEDLNRKLKCSHCGLPDGVYIGGLPSGAGHYRYCPKCGKTDICTYPQFFDTAIAEAKKELERKGYNVDSFIPKPFDYDINVDKYKLQIDKLANDLKSALMSKNLDFTELEEALDGFSWKIKKLVMSKK